MPRQLAPCGTPAAYKRHLYRKEVVDDACKEANAKHVKEYYAKHPEKKKAIAKEMRIKFADKIAADKKTWAEKNKDRLQAKYKVYYAENKLDFYSRRRKRQALLLNVETEPYTPQLILDTYGTVCYLCNEEIDLTAPRHMSKDGWERGLHLDHLIPLSKGGTDLISNIRPTHGLCNLSKGKSLIKDTVNA